MTDEQPEFQAQHARPLVGVLQVLVQPGRDDLEMRLAEPLHRVAHHGPGLRDRLGPLDLGPQLVMHLLPVEPTELGIEMPVTDCSPDSLERFHILRREVRGDRLCFRGRLGPGGVGLAIFRGRRGLLRTGNEAAQKREERAAPGHRDLPEPSCNPVADRGQGRSPAGEESQGAGEPRGNLRAQSVYKMGIRPEQAAGVFLAQAKEGSFLLHRSFRGSSSI